MDYKWENNGREAILQRLMKLAQEHAVVK